MPANAATYFPVYGQAFRIGVFFRSTTGTLITGWTGAVANVYPDNGGAVACAIAEAPGGSGFGYIDIPAAQMSCSMLGVVATVSNGSATPFTEAINPLQLMSNVVGAWDEQTVILFENMVMDIMDRCISQNQVQNGGEQTYNRSNSLKFQANYTESSTGATRGKMV
jgi:hypothetical protein